MKMQATASKGEFEKQLLPKGFYRVRLLAIEEKESTLPDSDTYWSWKFEILGGPANGQWIWGSTGTSLGYKSSGDITKPRKWINTLLGRDIGDDEAVDDGELVGLDAVAEVLLLKGKDGSPRNKIENLFTLMMAGPWVKDTYETTAAPPRPTENGHAPEPTLSEEMEAEQPDPTISRPRMLRRYQEIVNAFKPLGVEGFKVLDRARKETGAKQTKFSEFTEAQMNQAIEYLDQWLEDWTTSEAPAMRSYDETGEVKF